MLAFVYYLFLLLLWTHKNNKSIRLWTMSFLMLLFCLNTGIADRGNYELMIAEADLRVAIVELGWGQLLLLFSKLNLDVQFLYVTIGIAYLGSLYYVLPKLAKNSMPLVCFMIGVFFLDVVQLRNTLSMTFILWAFYWLLRYEGKKSVVGFVLFVCIASSIHVASSIFMLFLQVKFLSTKKIFFTTALVVSALMVSVMVLMLFLGEFLALTEKVETVLMVGSKSKHAVLVSCLWNVFLFYMCRYQKKHLSSHMQDSFEIYYKLSIISLSFIPFITFSPDFRRLVFFTFLILSSGMYSHLNYCKNRKVVRALPIILSVTFFIYSTFMGNRDVVFYPIFENNLLIQLFE